MNNTIIKNSHNDDFVVQNESNTEFESCVMCNKLTNVPKMLHIDFRTNYVEGAGQLCFECNTKSLQYIKD
jgi:hypothetical protein